MFKVRCLSFSFFARSFLSRGMKIHSHRVEIYRGVRWQYRILPLPFIVKVRKRENIDVLILYSVTNFLTKRPSIKSFHHTIHIAIFHSWRTLGVPLFLRIGKHETPCIYMRYVTTILQILANTDSLVCTCATKPLKVRLRFLTLLIYLEIIHYIIHYYYIYIYLCFAVLLCLSLSLSLSLTLTFFVFLFSPFSFSLYFSLSVSICLSPLVSFRPNKRHTVTFCNDR